MVLGLLLFFITLVLLVALLSMIWPPDSPWSPWWRTNKKTAKAIVALAKISKKDTVYDLGCGDGTALLECAKVGAKGVGVEIDPLRAWVAQARIFFSGNNKQILIKKENLFKANVSKATVIVLYLVPKTLIGLEKKFREELKPKTHIVTYVYPLPYFKKIGQDKKNNLYLYEVDG